MDYTNKISFFSIKHTFFHIFVTFFCSILAKICSFHKSDTPDYEDTITVTVAPEHVLVVSGYNGSEYAPYADFINVGDIHSCEPWLYSDCIRLNIRKRTERFISEN